jgi:hypothetical protein
MKHKVPELEGALLDAAVAKARGNDPDPFGASLTMQGMNLYEKEGIAVDTLCSPPVAKGWNCTMTGSTPRIAAMRAYVASKFGEEVELP